MFKHWGLRLVSALTHRGLVHVRRTPKGEVHCDPTLAQRGYFVCQFSPIEGGYALFLRSPAGMLYKDIFKLSRTREPMEGPYLWSLLASPYIGACSLGTAYIYRSPIGEGCAMLLRSLTGAFSCALTSLLGGGAATYLCTHPCLAV